MAQMAAAGAAASSPSPQPVQTAEDEVSPRGHINKKAAFLLNSTSCDNFNV